MTGTITRTLPRLTDGVETSLRHAVPEGICRTFRAVPYRHHQGQVLVAAASDDDAITEHVLAERLDAPVLLVRHPVAEITEAVDRAYPPVEAEVESPAARRTRLQISQMLSRSGLVDADQLQQAMLEYARTGDPLGDILVAQGAISEDILVAALSELHQVQRVGLADFEPDYDLARRLPERLARTLRALPVAETDETVLLAVARPLDAAASAEVEAALGGPFRPLLAHRGDLDRLVQRVHSSQYVDQATTYLVDNRPEQSAHVVITTAQRALLVLGGALLVVCGALWTTLTVTVLVSLCTLVYLMVALYRFRLATRTLGSHLETDVTVEEVAALDERTLPVYTILVPLLHEAEIVPRLIADLEALDYPATRLDVKLLCEDDDEETLEAVRALDLPPHFRLVVVPDTLPKTKPKACNYGLQLAEGAFTVIYDAEDRPDPDQLKKVLVAFERLPDRVACVQAKLNHYNAGQNLLTGWFANEYALQFELVLPAMAAAEVPIPLGGTSNHFRTHVLREVGAWDPFNVTEDADLGTRLHREGYRTAMVDSTTLEEANSRLGNWVRQRSRWSKGHFQTWLVHMRHPGRLLRETGPRGFLAFNLSMGQAFVLLLNPIFWALTTVYLLGQWGVVESIYPAPVFYLSSALLVLGNFGFVHLNVAGSLQRGEFSLTRVALLSPIYWGLMSYAAWRGFVQLFTNPFYWEKTVHGLDEG